MSVCVFIDQVISVKEQDPSTHHQSSISRFNLLKSIALLLQRKDPLQVFFTLPVVIIAQRTILSDPSLLAREW